MLFLVFRKQKGLLDDEDLSWIDVFFGDDAEPKQTLGDFDLLREILANFVGSEGLIPVDFVELGVFVDF